MPKITLLDENMINLIAAGEVIERPASVVKELIENSIDAEATRIIVELEDGGKKCIRITDNGTGLAADQMSAAFAPHATSKVKNPDDLHNITTMGFRGEALASIASIAKVSMLSRGADSIQANRIEIDCGKISPVSPAAADTGTTVEVRDLFYKLPARRKFLRSANTELSHITEHFTRIALAWPQLELTLIHNNRQLHHLLPGQTLTQRIQALFGPALADGLLETTSNEKNLSIHALLARPDSARTSASYQYFFLNRRYIRDKFIAHAIREAYRGLTEPGKYPIVFLFLRLDPQAFDVNVHPTKIEVRFDNSNLVHSQVLACLREKLLSTNLGVRADLPRQTQTSGDDLSSQDDPQRRQRLLDAMEGFFKSPTAAASQQRLDFHRPQYNQPRPFAPAARTGPDVGQTWPSAAPRFLQVQNCYLVIATDQGFEIVDQHALHERILYEKLKAKIASGTLPSQRLLIPQAFEITPAQAGAFSQHADLLARLGIEIGNFGPRTLAVQSFPTLLDKVEPADFVADLLDILSDKDLQSDPDKLLGRVLENAACKAAVKAGQPLSEHEVAQLLLDRQQYPQACRCPHGRPTSIAFSIDQLEKQFKRTGF